MGIQRLGLVGAGVMGRAIAKHWCSRGYDTVLVDVSQDQLDRVEPSPQLRCTTDVSGLADRDLILEAIYEDVSAKSKVLASLPTGPMIATNTSSLTVGALAPSVPDASRFFALHYNNPAETNPIVEIVPGEATSADVVEQARAFVLASGKRPVSSRDEAGFALNRQSLPYLNEAGRLLDEGLGSPTAIDRIAVRALGVGLGPFSVMNLVGTRVLASAIRNLSHHGAMYAPSECIQTMGASNAAFRLDDRGRANDAEVEARLTGAIFVAALEITERGLASPDDLDAICVEALGYPQGSIAMMRSRGIDDVETIVRATAGRYDMPIPSLDVIR